MKNEKMHMIKIKRDDDGYWGYDKTFDQFVTKDKQTAFNKVISELRNIVKTVRGRGNYPERIVNDIKSFLKLIDGEERLYYDIEEELHFNKDKFSIYFNFDWGNAYFHIDVVEVLVSSNDTDFSFIEIKD